MYLGAPSMFFKIRKIESKGDGSQQGGSPLVDVIDDVAAARVVVFVGRKPRLDAAFSSVCMCVYICVYVCTCVCMYVSIYLSYHTYIHTKRRT